MSLNVYPRPHFKRDESSWFHLHTQWDYKIVNIHIEKHLALIKDYLDKPDGVIHVPYSIETKNSKVEKQLYPHQSLLMRIKFDVPIELLDLHFLHFDAVDQKCRVWLNDVYLGYHQDGYLPFQFDISEILLEKNNELILAIIDESDRGLLPWGKQKLKKGGIWYTPQSGIWQPVWIETCPKSFVESFDYEFTWPNQLTLKTTTNDTQPVTIHLFEPTLNGQHDVDFLERDYPLLMTLQESNQYTIELEEIKYWSSEQPWLYPLEIVTQEDRIKTYVGCRSIEIKDNEVGIKKVTINKVDTFQSGVLDQGYYQNGLYTPDSDQMMIDDLVMLKNMGFNMVRKHIKVELARWYYHCDRLGLYVHQDMVNSGQQYNPLIIQVLPFINIHLKDSQYKRFGQENEQSRNYSIHHQKEVIKHLKPFCSIVTWVISNEGWGQFDTLKLTEMARQQDPSRLIDHASGWHDQKGGDFKSVHVYFKKIRLKADHRALMLSEFGGYSHQIKGHSFEKTFGYKKFKKLQDYQKAVLKLYEDEVFKYRKLLSACVYTQLSDVEEEINGLVTFDRQVIKWDVDVLKEMNERLIKGLI